MGEWQHLKYKKEVLMYDKKKEKNCHGHNICNKRGKGTILSIFSGNIFDAKLAKI